MLAPRSCSFIAGIAGALAAVMAYKKSNNSVRFLSMMHAAKHAKISIRHFRRIYTGRIIEIGRGYFTLKADLEAWLSSRRNASQ